MGTTESILYGEEGVGDYADSDSTGESVDPEEVAYRRANLPPPRPVPPPPPLPTHEGAGVVDERGGADTPPASPTAVAAVAAVPPLTLRGLVLGAPGTGKTCLVRRLRGEDPFADAEAAAPSGGGGTRRRRRRKMMALVPWKGGAMIGGAGDARSQRRRRQERHPEQEQACQLYVVEEEMDPEATESESTAPATAAAMEALRAGADFCVVMADPRRDSTVQYARDVIRALMEWTAEDDQDEGGAHGATAPAVGRGGRSLGRRGLGSKADSPPSRPCVCVLLNFSDVAVVEDNHDDSKDGDGDGGGRLNVSTLQALVRDLAKPYDIRTLKDGEAGRVNGETSKDDPVEITDRDEKKDGGDGDSEAASESPTERLQSKTSDDRLPPTLRVYPSSMVTCSGLPSLHSFVSLPFLRRKESNLLAEVEGVRERYCAVRIDLEKHIEKPIVGSSQTARAKNGRRRRIIATERGQQRVDSARRVRFEEDQMTSVSVGRDRHQSSQKVMDRETSEQRREERRPRRAAPERELHAAGVGSDRHVNIDEMTRRLEEADRLRRSRLKSTEVDRGQASYEQVDEQPPPPRSSGGRRLTAGPQRELGGAEPVRRPPAAKRCGDDPAGALEAFLAEDSDSDSNSGGIGDALGGRNKANLAVLDSDSEDDDFYYDDRGQTHFSHLDQDGGKIKVGGMGLQAQRSNKSPGGPYNSATSGKGQSNHYSKPSRADPRVKEGSKFPSKGGKSNGVAVSVQGHHGGLSEFGRAEDNIEVATSLSGGGKSAGSVDLVQEQNKGTEQQSEAKQKSSDHEDAKSIRAKEEIQRPDRTSSSDEAEDEREDISQTSSIQGESNVIDDDLISQKKEEGEEEPANAADEVDSVGGGMRSEKKPMNGRDVNGDSSTDDDFVVGEDHVGPPSPPTYHPSMEESLDGEEAIDVSSNLSNAIGSSSRDAPLASSEKLPGNIKTSEPAAAVSAAALAAIAAAEEEAKRMMANMETQNSGDTGVGNDDFAHSITSKKEKKKKKKKKADGESAAKDSTDKKKKKKKKKHKRGVGGSIELVDD